MYAKQHRSFYNGILRLNAYKQEYPAESLQYFIAKYELTEVRQLLHQLVEVALTTNNKAFSKAKDRARAVRFANDVEELIEAIHLLQEPH